MYFSVRTHFILQIFNMPDISPASTILSDRVFYNLHFVIVTRVNEHRFAFDSWHISVDFAKSVGDSKSGLKWCSVNIRAGFRPRSDAIRPVVSVHTGFRLLHFHLPRKQHQGSDQTDDVKALTR